MVLYEIRTDDTHLQKMIDPYNDVILEVISDEEAGEHKVYMSLPHSGMHLMSTKDRRDAAEWRCHQFERSYITGAQSIEVHRTFDPES